MILIIFNLQNRYLNMEMNKPKWYEVSEFDMQKLDKLILEIVSAAMKVFPKDIK